MSALFLLLAIMAVITLVLTGVSSALKKPWWSETTSRIIGGISLIFIGILVGLEKSVSPLSTLSASAIFWLLAAILLFFVGVFDLIKGIKGKTDGKK